MQALWSYMCKLPDFIFTIPRQHTFSRYSLFWATYGRCVENAADLPEHLFLAAIFLTDDITRVLHSCDDNDNEHMLLSKSRLWCYGVSPQRGVGLLLRSGQERHVLRLVCVWSWLGRRCVLGPRAVQSVRLELPRRQVCTWPTLHVGSLDSRSSCTSLPADARCFCGSFSGLRA